ncbi:hypothetical protein EGT49_08565 [Companilactobacillus suantsaicola]|uniref:Lipoprotein n=1 Tax=Companilactobacillus suantsaicola TaxID=2487723 RepID=A0A4Z0JJU1_9LACO|nr:hypothetical protein [Companilactobacillus suantsaicola]TGD22558.1 hypothetical protein EGT49_08565 [Companilactobacillus suantsaicola]
MKKALLLATTGVALLLAGCSNGAQKSTDNSSSTYKTEMSKGNDAVNDEKYSKAMDHFASAIKAKKTDKAHDSKVQAQNLVKAKKLMNQRKFDGAKNALNEVTDQDNGNQKMVKHANKLLKKIKVIKTNRSNFTKNIATAQDVMNDAPDQAKTLLEQVTNFEGIKGKYYSDLYKQAKKLLANLPVKAENDTTTDTKADNSANTNNNDSTSADSNNGSDNQSGNPAANGDFDIEKKEIDGKTITDADINKAREDLSKQGVNAGAWSDNDIVRAIKNAYKDGRTTVTADDAKIQN